MFLQVQAQTQPALAHQDHRGPGPGLHSGLATPGLHPRRLRAEPGRRHPAAGHPVHLRLAGVDHPDGRGVVPKFTKQLKLYKMRF
jgi:hypothetical protein